MAFGGVITSTTPNGPALGGAKSDYIRATGATLAILVGAFNIANADSGRFTTGTPAANETQLDATFGRGAGAWVAGDENRVIVAIEDGNAAAQGAAGQTSLVYVSSITITGGDLVINVHNHGAQASGSLTLKILFVN